MTAPINGANHLERRAAQDWRIALYCKVTFFLIISPALLSYLTGKLKKLLIEKAFPHYNLDVRVSLSVATIIRCIIIILGIFIIFQTSGIKLSALMLLFGTLGFG